MADTENKVSMDVKAPEGEKTQVETIKNEGPSVEELRKQNEEFQKQIKERDTQIADLNTTKATLEARFSQINSTADRVATEGNKDLQERAKKIMQNATYDPEGAGAELTNLLSEMQTNVSRDAVTKAQQAIQSQTTIEKLRQGIKSSNPEFDDEVVDVIMNRADEIARSGKVKTADEAISAATTFVKSKFDAYAQKKNAAPVLPAGALAEGGSNRAPEVPKAETIPSAADEIEARKTGLQKKIL